MVRSRGVSFRSVGIIVVVAALVTATLGYLLDDAVLATTGRTAVLVLSSCIAGAILALPLSLSTRLPSIIPVPFVLLAGAFPILIPSPVIAAILVGPPFNMPPYGFPLLLVATMLTAMPIAFLTQVILLHRIDITAIEIATTLGRSPAEAVFSMFRGDIIRALAVSVLYAALLSATDPGIALAFGGNESHFSSATVHSLTADVPPHLPIQLITVTLACCVAVLLTSFLLARPSFLVTRGKTAVAQGKTALASSFQPLLRLSSSQLPASRRLTLTGLFNICIYTAIVITLVVRVLHNLRDGGLGRIDVAGPMTSTIALVLPTVVLSFITGSLLAYGLRRGKLRFTIKLVVAGMALVGLTCGGMIISLIHSDWIAVGGVGIVPPLVGGATIGGGSLGIGLAYATIALPLMFFTVELTIRSNADLIEAAEDCGASSLRIFFTIVLPRSILPWIGMTAFLLGVLLSRAIPAIYVDSTPWPQLGPLLASAAAAGQDDQLLILGLATVIVGSVLLLVVVSILTFLGVISSEAKSGRERRWIRT